jgi:hypothetical protein
LRKLQVRLQVPTSETLLLTSEQGSYSAMIAFEYFRFETWIQQSGFLYIDLEGNPAISNNVGPTEPSTQPRRPGIPLDTSPRGSWTLKAISEIHLILEELEKLKIKYGLDQPYKDSIGRSLQPPFYDQTRQLSTTGSVLPPETQQMRSVLNAVSKSKKQRENLSKHVTFFKKLNFSWALTDDTSDKDKIATLITRLQYWNNNLREMLPPTEQSFNDTLVSTRALSLSEEAECLEQISNAAHLIDGTLYGNIWKAANIKSQRVHGKRSDLIGQKFCGMELSKEHFIKIIDEPERGLTSFIPRLSTLIRSCAVSISVD